MTKTKINVAIGVATGVLVGFVFGAVFGSPEQTLEPTGGKAAGNIANVANYRKSLLNLENKTEESCDSLKLKASDEDGKEMTIIIIK